MSTTIDNGGPAFPFAGQDGHVYNDQGMSLRDYFAAKAIAVCLEHCSTNERAAEEAYKVADAMLKARQP